MLLKSLQLYETILSKKKSAEYWYRGVNENVETIEFNPKTQYGDKTKALWFTTNLDL
jgi:hypothetical protein